jgi:hypothetical protein
MSAVLKLFVNNISVWFFTIAFRDGGGYNKDTLFGIMLLREPQILIFVSNLSKFFCRL